ncbi:MAG: hypothetical protein K2X66_18545, partial [Cyanobacteria bacterium]|nr:hypothetical protein [Cyanobacteriota bacterium]
AQEILHELKWEPEEKDLACAKDPTEPNEFPAQKVEPGLEGDSQKILDLVPYDPILIETVQTQSGLPADKFYQILTLLELDGRVERASGAQIYRC